MVRPNESGKTFEVFVPDFNLQGDTFPFTILWKGDLRKIRISYGKGIKPKSLYNAVPESVKLVQCSIEITEMEVNGYLGGLFHGIFDEYSTERIEEIKFELTAEYETTKITKRITLFRPDMKIDDVPKEIFMNFKNITNGMGEIATPSQTLTLTNHGVGTAVLLIDLNDDSDLELTLPKEYLDFVNQFAADLNQGFQELASEFPDYQKLIESYLNVLKSPIPTADDALHYKKTIDEMESTMMDDEEFSNELVGVVIRAIVKNITITRDVQALVAYLTSMKPNRVLLLNPFTEIKLPIGTSTLKLRISVTDLSRNAYNDLLASEVRITSEKNTQIRLSSLINFGNGD